MIQVFKTVTYFCRQKDGFEVLGAQMRASKVDDSSLTQLSLEILAAAVRLDGHCKTALSEKPDILQCITKLLAHEQVRALCTPFYVIASMRHESQEPDAVLLPIFVSLFMRTSQVPAEASEGPQHLPQSTGSLSDHRKSLNGGVSDRQRYADGALSAGCSGGVSKLQPRHAHDQQDLLHQPVQGWHCATAGCAASL